MTRKGSETTEEADSPLGVLLIEAQPVILAGLTSIFDEEPDLDVCGSFETCGAALEAVDELAPDVIVYGLANGDDAGFDFLTSVNGLPVLILTNCDDPRVAHRALQLGARGYILTLERCENFALAVKLVAGGEVYLSGSMVTKMLARPEPGLAAGSCGCRHRHGCLQPSDPGLARLRRVCRICPPVRKMTSM